MRARCSSARGAATRRVRAATSGGTGCSSGERSNGPLAFFWVGPDVSGSSTWGPRRVGGCLFRQSSHETLEGIRVPERRAVAEADQLRTKGGELAGRSPVDGRIPRKHGEWLRQSAAQRDRIPVEEHVSQNQRPVVRAPEGDVPRRVARRLDHREAANLVALPERSRHGVGGPCEQPGKAKCRASRFRKNRGGIARLQSRAIAFTAPDRNPQRLP